MNLKFQTGCSLLALKYAAHPALFLCHSFPGVNGSARGRNYEAPPGRARPLLLLFPRSNAPLRFNLPRCPLCSFGRDFRKARIILSRLPSRVPRVTLFVVRTERRTRCSNRYSRTPSEYIETTRERERKGSQKLFRKRRKRRRNTNFRVA